MAQHAFASPAAVTQPLSRRSTWPRIVASASMILAVALLSGCISSLLPKKQATLTVPPPPPATGKLAPIDVQVLLGTGASFTEAIVGGKTYTVVLNADGSAQRTATGSKTPETGTWRAAEPGYCSKWGKTAAEDCYTINRTAAATYDVVDAKNKVIAHLTAS